VGPRAGLDDTDKRKFLTIPGPEPRPLRRPARSRSLYRLRYLGSSQRRVVSIKMNLREIGWCGMNWIDLDQGRDQWRAFVNTVMILHVP
jgi:hypothetical protein